MSKGLLTLQTDLKSLRYGNDKPYITKDINNAPSSNQADMRGTKRVDDLSRITQMLVDRPGLKHLGNEALLRQVGVEDRIRKSRKSGKTVAGALLKELGGTALATIKVIGSTLIQVPVNGTGTHFLRGFRTDTYLQPSGGNTRSSFAQFFGAGGVEGAPYAIRGEEIPGEAVSNFGTKVSNTEFKVELGSKYDYDEYLNKPTGSNQAKLNTLEGKPVTIPGPQYETTAQPSQLGRSNQLKEADQPELLPDNGNDGTQAYNIENTYAGSSPVNNIGTVLTGKPVTLAGPQYETTAQPFQLGRSNKLSEADQPEILSNNGNDGTQNYYPDSTYTGNTAQDSIERALDGKRISTNKGEKYQEDYLRNNSWFNTDGTQQALVENVEDEKGNVQEEKSQGSTVGESSIPKLTSLKVLREQINTGSAATIGQDYDNINTSIQDFRQGSKTSYSYDYNTKDVHKEQRVNLGNQGRKKEAKAKVNYMTTDDLAVDKINAADISTKGRLDGTEGGRDLAKFYFEIITPDSNTFLHFRAFIESIDDGYTADWKAHKYVGRAENFYTYGGFDRDINVSFKIAAATRKEMKPLYRKMVYLASSTAPTYGTSGLMRGTLARLTIGSYFSQIPGVITSVKFTLDNEAPWEIAMGNPDGGAGSNKDDDVQELPMVLNCSVSFKPIHDFAPQTGLYHYFTNPEPIGAKDFLK